MRVSLKVLAGMALVLGTALQAQANPISVSPSTAVCGTPTCLHSTGDETSQNAIVSQLEASGLTELYKKDAPTAESGSFAGSYDTVFNGDLSGGTISWVSSQPYINLSSIYLLVKDGNHVPAWYLFDISNWNGQSDIVMSGFWPEGGAISNVGIWGGTSPVPDGGSMATLLGMALFGLAAVRRRMVA